MADRFNLEKLNALIAQLATQQQSGNLRYPQGIAPPQLPAMGFGVNSGGMPSPQFSGNVGVPFMGGQLGAAASYQAVPQMPPMIAAMLNYRKAF